MTTSAGDWSVVDCILIDSGLCVPGLAASPDGKFVYQTGCDNDQLNVIDTASNTLVSSITLALPPSDIENDVRTYAQEVVLSPDGSRAFVLSVYLSKLPPGDCGMLSVVDTSAGKCYQLSRWTWTRAVSPLLRMVNSSTSLMAPVWRSAVPCECFPHSVTRSRPWSNLSQANYHATSRSRHLGVLYVPTHSKEGAI